MKYLFIPCYGELKVINVTDDKVPEFDFFRKIISANSLEVVHCSMNYRHLMLVDEWGKIIDPPKLVNFRASALYGGAPFDLICGDVILGKEGYTPDGVDIVGLTDEEILKYLRFFCEDENN